MSGEDAERFEIRGRLTMDTVPALFEQGLRKLEAGDLRADLSKVESVDSAALSLLLGWERAAHSKRRDLRVTGLPQDLLSLAYLYGVDDLLPARED